MRKLVNIGAVAALVLLALPGLARAAAINIGAGGEKLAGGQSGFHTINIAGGGKITCNVVSFASIGKVSTGDKVVTLTPTYKECAVERPNKEIFSAEITVNSCHYKFDEINTTGFGDFEGTWDIVCPGTNTMRVHIYDKAKNKLCEYSVAAQTGLKKLTAENKINGTGIDMLFSLIDVGVAYTRTVGKEADCGTATGVAKYNGATTLEGFTAGGGLVNVSLV